MTAPGNGILLTLLIVVLAASTGYAAGRIHQWYRTSLERDEAYRDGYDTATQSLFSVAARLVKQRRDNKSAARGTAVVSSILEAPGAAKATDAAVADKPVSEGKHTVPDELVQAPTYRLSPDRIARAKVPNQNLSDEKTSVVKLPTPRAS
ncbi:MAG TPA: hypothetical protein VFO77_02090 [Actinoplanes sp.]|nr:hypothetical protein [Actinoplanes sp.]